LGDAFIRDLVHHNSHDAYLKMSAAFRSSTDERQFSKVIEDIEHRFGRVVGAANQSVGEGLSWSFAGTTKEWALRYAIDFESDTLHTRDAKVEVVADADRVAVQSFQVSI
jgi:hypothetical protein